MEKTKLSDKALVNKRSTTLFTVITVVLAVAYLVQFLKGEKTLGLFLILLVLDLVPTIACWVINKKTPENTIIKHIMSYGYGLFYLVSCFTSTELTVYVYAIPMLIIVPLFSDNKYSKKVAVACGGISVVHAIWFCAGTGFETTAVAAMEIEIAVMLMVTIFGIVTNKTITEIADKKVDQINEASAKTEELLNSIMDISGKLAEDVNLVSEKMKDLEESSSETYNAMMEVQSGTGESAESIQNQLLKTEEIQTQINMVTDVAKNIGEDVVQTVDACHEGRDNIAELLNKAQASEEAGIRAVKEVEQLKDATNKMQSIVELIQSVASQTSLLALNASIEAARAGEAGRGFSVVATEISNLANQTQSATGNISELITDIASEITEVVATIDSLVDNNRAQNESANVTNGSFEKIIENIRSIRSNSNELTGVVGKLAGANQEIVESIQTISAITEEVSAHSSSTCETSQKNQEIVADVISIVSEMSNNATELSNMNI